MHHAPPAQEVLLRLEGPRLLYPDGTVCAELGDDHTWRTADGLPTRSVTVESPKVHAHVDPGARSRAQRESDRAWLEQAVEVIAALASSQAELSSDDVWSVIGMPPREPRMVGNAMARAQRAGHIEPTDRDQQSRRTINHGRPVRIWRSLRYGQQQLGGLQATSTSTEEDTQ
ncbi:MAG: hypothetical protein JHD16_00285 [Solirubrobacteraceae bacterium]|nr:hypothetical protein [Solirubrobacteraceae bacterium]